jgi:hypothetical protein
MTTDPDRPMKTLILDLMIEVKELRMQVSRMEEAADRRHRIVMDAIEPEFEEVDPPADVSGPLSEWMKR